MKRTFFSAMLAMLLIVLLALPAQAGSNPRLPDLSAVLGVEGEFYKSTQEKQGLCHTYIYEVEMTVDEAGKAIVVYTEELKRLGFEAQTGKAENAIRYMTFTCDTGKTELAVFVMDGAKSLANGGEGLLWFVLVVPDTTEFVLGKGSSGILNGGTRCIECGGSKKCAYCGGSGRYNYGNGYEACVVCDGDRICTVCDGKGSY